MADWQASPQIDFSAQQEMEQKMKPVVALPGKENTFVQVDVDALNARRIARFNTSVLQVGTGAFDRH